MTNLLALANGTELVGDYRIRRVLGAGGFGITYLADEIALARQVTIKEYFPADFAARKKDADAAPRSKDCAADYKWGLDRFIEEAQTLARFEHPNIVRVFRYFRANNTGYMVLQWEEGKSFKGWLKDLGRAPRQQELDAIVGPLLEALERVHKGDYLHRDIAPDNIIIRKDKSPVLIDFGSARGEIASQSRTVSALVKPGYSPYEQYATTTSQQGPWTDIYALGATLYQAVTGKRPPDAPSRVVNDEYVPAREAAIGSFRPGFLAAIDHALRIEPKDRPQTTAAWRDALLAPPEKPPAKAKLGMNLGLKKTERAPTVKIAEPAAAAASAPVGAEAPANNLPAARANAVPEPVQPANPRYGVGYGPAPATAKAAPAAAAVAVPAATMAPVPVAVAPAAPKPLPVKRRGPWWKRALFFLRPPWRGLIFKLGVGAGVASLAVAHQNQLMPPPLPSKEARTTARPAPAPTAESRPAAPSSPAAALPSHRGPVLALGFLNGGQRTVTIGADALAHISDTNSGAVQRTIPLTFPPAVASPAVAPALSAPALVAASIQGTTALAVHADGTVVTWDLDKGERSAVTRRNDGAVSAAAALDELERLAAAGPDGRVVLLDRKTGGQPVTSAESHGDGIRALTLVPGRSVLATASIDKTVKVWNTETLALIRTYRGHGAGVTAIDSAPDGRSLASAGEDGQIRLWSTASNRLIRSFKAHTARITSVSYAPGGEVIVSAAEDGSVKLWDARRGKLVQELPPKNGSVRSVTFAADGRRLVVAGEDGTVKLWDAGPIRLARD